MHNGYIYVIKHLNYDDKVFKFGSTKYPYNRLTTLQTGSHKTIYYKKLFKIIDENYTCYRIDDLFQEEFFGYKWKTKYQEGGEEWYDENDININNIEKFLNDNNIKYLVVELKDCDKYENKNEYYKELEMKENKKYYLMLSKQPYEYQKNINLEDFKINKKGKILWACGTGKTFTSLYISYLLNLKNILIGVPSNYLLNQFKNVVRDIFKIDSLSLNDKNFERKLLSNNINIVVITYHSANKCLKKIKEIGFEFDIKIGDEAHHLVSNIKDDDSNTFEKFHFIPSEYSLFLTATEKNFNEQNRNIFNMSDETKFGKVIDKKTVKWAIENKKITDYNILCIYNKSDEIHKIMKDINIDIICENDIKCDKKELFLSAYSALKCIEEGKITHTLIYVNKCSTAKIVKKIIDELIKKNIFQIDNLYNKDLHNETKNIFHDDNEEEECEICKFKKSSFGIISCVYIFGEGCDIPYLNGVVIGEKMNSEIRIVQSCLRANRLDKNNPDKIANIIIPTNIKNIDEKVKMVISKLAQEDKIIEQKIKLYQVNSYKRNQNAKEYNELKLDFEPNLLNKLKLDLYKSFVFGMELTLKKEYQLYSEYVKKSQFKTIKEYLDSNFEIRNPDIYFYNVWTGWYDFLGIDTSQYIKDKNRFIKYVKSKGKIRNYQDYLSVLDEKMPPEPEIFYKNFTNFNVEFKSNNSFVFI